MQIYLLRHGIAEDYAATGLDSDRALTAEGRKKLREVLEASRRAGLQPQLILTSPYRRAVETAEIAADALRYAGKLVTIDALTPEADPRELWDELRAHRGFEQILLASHEPLMSRSAAYMLDAPALAIDFKKAGILRIDIDRPSAAPRGVLKWYLTPKLAG
jgi:phosphohistidine phosphatase